MNRLRMLAASVLALGWGSMFLRAEGPDDEYVQIYHLIQQADALADSGRNELAKQKYSEAHQKLDRVQRAYPGWNEQVIQFRLNYVQERLGLAKAGKMPTQIEPAEREKPAPATTDSVDRIKVLLEQIRQLTADRDLLQAKLKEALSAQPAAVDPRELARSEEQIRSLRKDVEVLTINLKKAVTRPDKPIDPAAFDQMKQELDWANQKLGRQMEALTSLTLERDAMQRRLQTLADGAEIQALRRENESLKRQINEPQIKDDELKQRQADLATRQSPKGKPVSERRIPDARPSESVSRQDGELVTKTRTLEKELAEARRAAQTNADLVSVLQSALRRVQEEKDILERRNQAKTPAPAQPSLDESLPYQIAVLRARLAALETGAVPYSPEERALFRGPEVTGTNADSKRSSGQLPAGGKLGISQAPSAVASQHYDNAEKRHIQGTTSDEKNIPLNADLAVAQIGQNRVAEGEAALKRALARDPNNALNLSLLGVVKVRQHKYDEALDLLSQSAQLDPQNANTFQYLGVTLAEKGLRKPAESAFRRAIQLAPENAEAHHNLAVVYATQQPPALELARLHYQKGLASGHPKDSKLEELLRR